MTTPLQYKEATSYFMDFSFGVSRHTFIPRPETELVVERAVYLAGHLREKSENNVIKILEIGTGSGNIAVSLASYMPDTVIVAVDVSEKALETAKNNAIKYNVQHQIKFVQSDLFASVHEAGEFDMIISNPPYVSLDDMLSLPDVVKKEPYVALFGGDDGLYFYREICSKAVRYLKKNAFILFEIGYNQSEDVANIMKESHIAQVSCFKDYNGIDRIMEGRI